MKNSIYIKNFLSTALMVFLSFFILGSVFSGWSYRLIMNEKQEAMQRVAQEACTSISAFSSNWSLRSFETKMVLSMISGSSGYDIIITDTEGNVISCSDRSTYCEHMDKTVPPQILSDVYESDEGYSGRSSLGNVYSQTRYVYGVSLDTTSGTHLGYMFLSTERSSMSVSWREFSGTFVLVAMCVLVLTFILSFISTKRQAEPLNEMALTAHKFARGDYSARVEETDREDEIGQLAAAFNAMADSIERSESLRQEFIANISHELKTPITTISGFSDGILDGTIPPEKQGEYLTIISSESKRMSRLVRSMLDMSKLRDMDPEELLRRNFDAVDTVGQTLLSLEGKINSRRLDVDAMLPEEPVIVRGDRDSITQVIYNLLDNAIKFAEEGSVLKVSLWKESGRAHVAIQNTGATIPEEELPLIFDRFHKTDRSRSMDREGVGLGLYIVKTILDNHNENIYVTSRDGVTKFEFTLTVLS